MSQLLEILGRAITVDITDLIWHWLNAVKILRDESQAEHFQQLNKVIELLGDMKLEAASEQLRIYLFDNSACVYGRMAAAAICLHNNDLNEAVKELQSVYMRQPTNTMALYALGHCYERLGKEAEAIEFYQDCLKFKSYLQLPAQRLAAIYFKKGQTEKTIEQYEILRQEYPDDISLLVTLGHLYIATEQYMKAVETFNNAILIHPDNFHSQDENIDRLFAEGRFNEALEQIEYLLQDQPDRPDLLMKHADILRMLGNNNDAVSQYEEALQHCPDFLEATIKLGTQYLQIHQEKLAAQQFNKAVEINDKIVDAYLGLATAQKLAGYEQDALGTVSLAAAIVPNSSMLFAETAVLQFQEGMRRNMSTTFESEYDDTVQEQPANNLTGRVVDAHIFQITKHPQNPDLHYRLGVLMMSIGRLVEAIISFESALEINQDYRRARNKLAVCLFEVDRRAEALEHLSAPSRIDTATLDLHYKTALLYCDKIKFASSLMNLERHLEKNYAHPDAAVNISIVLQNLGLLDRVSTMWDNLADTADQAMNTDFPFPI
ncbi:MAG: tetratricopeptide repeat protein [Sedimentisphaerales bacterium]|nr:tetratricopeptide repeat protein [Sedimentisphaerales bacterium]